MTNRPRNSALGIDFSAYIDDRGRDFSRRDWIFKALDEWLSAPDRSRFFIITGAPGAGKTAIAARLAQFSAGLCKAPEGLITASKGFLSAIHFCWFRERRWLNPNVFSSSISLQLARRHSLYALALVESNPERRTRINVNVKVGQARQVTGVAIKSINIGTVAPENAFMALVREPLEKLFRDGFQERIIILIDAIDEAVDYEGKVGIAALISQAEMMPSGVRFIITSRPDSSLLAPFRRGSATELSLSSASDLNNSCNDVKQYALKSVAALPQSSKLSGTVPSIAIANAVSEKSKGNFLYAKHVINMLGGYGKAIDLDSINTLPETLDGVYREFLDRLAERGRIAVSEQSLALGVLAVVQEHITETQLSEFVGVNVSHIRQLLKPLRPFLDVDETQPASRRRYALYHRSFAEFILDRDRAETYWRDPKEYHALITRRYLVFDNSATAQLDYRRLDKYGCRNLALHLFDADDYELLFAIGRDPQFLVQQQQQLADDPDAPVATLRITLQGAIAQNNPVAMAEFCLRHSVLLSRLRVSRPSTEQFCSTIDSGLRFAEQQTPAKMALWFLFFINDAIDNHPQNSRAALNRLIALQTNMPRLTGWQAALAAVLLPTIDKLDETVLEALAHRLLDGDGLCSFVRCVAGTNPSLSLRVAEAIEDSEQRSKAMQAVAEGLAKSDPAQIARFSDQAVAAAGRITERRHRVDAMVAFLRNHVASRNGIENLIKEARAVAKSIDDETDSANALISIARAAAEHGASDASVIANEALAKAREITVESIDTTETTSYLDIIKRVLSRAPGASRQARALAGVAGVFTEIRHPDAESIFFEALHRARSLPEEDMAFVLRAIGGELCSIHEREYWPFLDRAIELVDEIRHRDFRLELLTDITKTIGKHRRRDRVRLIDTILSVSRSMERPQDRCLMLAMTAAALTQIGETVGFEVLSEALAEMRNVNDQWDGWWVTKKIIESLDELSIDDAKRNFAIVSEAVRATKHVPRYDERLAMLAIANYKGYGDKFAEVVCELLSIDKERVSGAERLRAMAALARELGQPDLREAVESANEALAAARSIADVSYRGRALLAVSSIYHQMGRRDAEELRSEALALAYDLNEKTEQAKLLTTAAEAFVEVDDLRADGLLREAFECAQKIPHHLSRAEALTKIAIVEGELRKNEDLLDQIDNEAGKLRSEVHRAQVLLATAESFRKIGDRIRAAHNYVQAWINARSIELFERAVEIWPRIAVEALRLYKSDLVVLGPKENARIGIIYERQADGQAKIAIGETGVDAGAAMEMLGGPPFAAQWLYDSLFANSFKVLESISDEGQRGKSLAALALSLRDLDRGDGREKFEAILAASRQLKNEFARARALAEAARTAIRWGEFVGASSIMQEVLVNRREHLIEVLHVLATQNCLAGLARFLLMSSEFTETAWVLIHGLVQARPKDAPHILEGLRRVQAADGPPGVVSSEHRGETWETLFGPEKETSMDVFHNIGSALSDYYLFSDAAGRNEQNGGHS